MNQLTTNPKSHVIITFTKVHHFITRRQYEWLQGIGKGVKFDVAGNEVNTNNIADVLTIEKYYETFPEKQTKNYHQPYSDVHGNVLTRISKNGREFFLKGLRRATPDGKFLRDMEAGKSDSKPKTYNPKFSFEKVVEEGKPEKFVLKPLN